MFATIVTVKIKPKKWEEAWKMGEKRAKEQTQIPGMKGYFVMSDLKAHKVVKVVLWESEEVMKKYAESSGVHEAMEQSEKYLAGPMEIVNLPVVASSFSDTPVSVM
ncbi:MAG: hypothetical protein K8T10_10020 [Candidatus Eremiobacteraeota bacterium]|nr:hypothetical protein [Candidatus Eremiobacteraeota bacterium]